jgi:hypothetical protein
MSRTQTGHIPIRIMNREKVIVRNYETYLAFRDFGLSRFRDTRRAPSAFFEHLYRELTTFTSASLWLWVKRLQILAG